MGLLSALVDVIFPVVLVAGVGWGLGKRFTLDLDTLTRMSLHGLTPAFVLNSLLTTTVSLSAGALLLVGYLLVALIGCALAWLATPGIPGDTRRAMMTSVTLGNNGNMGLPIALFALGREGLDQSTLIFLASVVLTFTAGPLLLGSVEGPVAAVRGMLRMPALWAVALALVVRTFNVPVPVGVSRGVELLAGATLPLLLLTLGIQIGSTGRPRFTRAVLTATALRSVGLACVAAVVGLVLGLPALALQALVLASAMPTAVNAYLLARAYGSDHRSVADVVTLSTAASFVGAGLVTAALPLLASLAG